MKNILVTLLTLLTFITHADDSTENNSVTPPDIEVMPEYIFTPTNKLSNQVKQALLSAKKDQKLALFVLGAQWCHDSKGLAKNFSTPEMQKILSKNYHVLFVDVGYLETGFELVQQFDLPIYYGTPTVMVVNPETNELLNKSTMRKWLNAYKVPLNEYQEYFSDLSENRNIIKSSNSTMLEYMSQIDTFEKQQAQRLKSAYLVVGPMLKAYVESDDKKTSSSFTDVWKPVQEYRYRVQNDLKALINQAKQNIEQGNTAELTLPSYPAFAWE